MAVRDRLLRAAPVAHVGIEALLQSVLLIELCQVGGQIHSF